MLLIFMIKRDNCFFINTYSLLRIGDRRVCKDVWKGYPCTSCPVFSCLFFSWFMAAWSWIRVMKWNANIEVTLVARRAPLWFSSTGNAVCWDISFLCAHEMQILKLLKVRCLVMKAYWNFWYMKILFFIDQTFPGSNYTMESYIKTLDGFSYC